MGIFASLRKSSRLRAISKKLGRPPRQATLEDVLAAPRGVPPEEQALFQLVLSDQSCQRVLAQHAMAADKLPVLYHALLIGGAGQWVSGHWVAASALAFGSTLDYLLRNTSPRILSGDHSFSADVCFRLVQYFKRGEMGAVT